MRASRPSRFDALERIDDRPFMRTVVDGYGWAGAAIADLVDDRFVVRQAVGGIGFESLLDAVGALITPDQPLVVSDTRSDSRFASAPLLDGQTEIRSILAAAFTSPSGGRVGVFITVDTEPHPLGPAETGRLALAVSMLRGQYADILGAWRAHAVQRALLPSEQSAPAGYQVDGCSIVHGNITGDYFDWSVTEEGRFVFGLAEAAGSGAAAGMLAAAARAALRSASYVGVGTGADLSDVFAHAARILEDDLASAGSSVTALYGSLDTVSGEVQYVTAGSAAPLVLRRSGGPVTAADDQDVAPAIGEASGSSWSMRSVVLGEGDTLIMPSAAARAVVQDLPGDAFDAERVVDVVEAYGRAHGEQDSVAVLALHRRGS